MNNQIRLLQITHDLAIGGLQQVVVNLCKTIDKKRFHVTVLCLRSLGVLTRDLENLGIEVILLPQKKTATDYLSFLKVAKILRQENIQVIHTHNTQPLIDGTLGALFSGKKIRIVHTDHARQFPDKKRYMFAEWAMSNFVYKIVGVSEQTTQNLRKFEKIANSKLMTIENGIDGDRFTINIDYQAKKKELGISLSGSVIGVVSRLEKVKGVSYLIRALPDVIKEFPDLTLLVIGDGSERHNLQSEVRYYGVEDNVIFTGARYDIPEIFSILDIYLLPSLSEGLPLTLLEAMATGCPIIASSVGGIPSVLKNGESAILVTSGTVDQLSFSIINLLQNNILRRTLSTNSKHIFENYYDIKLMTKKYVKLYTGSC